MNKILIVSATLFEIEPIIEKLGYHSFSSKKGAALFFDDNPKFDVLVTGIGQAACAFHTARILAAKQYSLAINLGIAGSFREDLPAKSIVQINKEFFADLGSETPESFLDIFTMNLEMDLLDKNEFPYTDSALINPAKSIEPIKDLPFATSITVNRILGRKNSIDYVRQTFSPDVVNMEGAAFFFACLHYEMPFFQIRTISDQVGELDRSKWDFKGSIQVLNKKSLEIIDFLSEQEI